MQTSIKSSKPMRRFSQFDLKRLLETIFKPKAGEKCVFLLILKTLKK